MFELRKSFTFEAAHQLVHHDGKCANLHGHSYGLTVELRANSLHRTGPKRNMVTDFSDISRVVKKLIRSHLDHHHLNTTLGTDSPTAEYIAQWVYHRLKPDLPYLAAVQINETANSSVTYRPAPTRTAFASNGTRTNGMHAVKAGQFVNGVNGNNEQVPHGLNGAGDQANGMNGIHGQVTNGVNGMTDQTASGDSGVVDEEIQNPGPCDSPVQSCCNGAFAR